MFDIYRSKTFSTSKNLLFAPVASSFRGLSFQVPLFLGSSRVSNSKCRTQRLKRSPEVVIFSFKRLIFILSRNNRLLTAGTSLCPVLRKWQLTGSKGASDVIKWIRCPVDSVDLTLLDQHCVH